MTILRNSFLTSRLARVAGLISLRIDVSMSTLFDGLGIKLIDGLPATDSSVL